MVRKEISIYYWIIPIVTFLILIIVVPFFNALKFSFQDYNLARFSTIGDFVGLNNYRNLILHDRVFGKSVIRTFIFTLSVVSVELCLGMLVALILNRDFPFQRLVLTMFILPAMLAPVAVGLIWRFLLYPQVGLLTCLLNEFGFFLEKTVLGQGKFAFMVIIFVDIWEWTPFMGLIFLAGLKALPRDPFDAAKVDGASCFQTFRFVTLPLLTPLIFVALVFRFIEALKLFDTVFILTGGGPGDATEVMNLYIYRLNFLRWNLGYGATPAVVILMVMFLLTSIFVVLWDYYAKRRKGYKLQV